MEKSVLRLSFILPERTVGVRLKDIDERREKGEGLNDAPHSPLHPEDMASGALTVPWDWARGLRLSE